MTEPIRRTQTTRERLEQLQTIRTQLVSRRAEMRASRRHEFRDILQMDELISDVDRRIADLRKKAA